MNNVFSVRLSYSLKKFKHQIIVHNVYSGSTLCFVNINNRPIAQLLCKQFCMFMLVDSFLVV